FCFSYNFKNGQRMFKMNKKLMIFVSVVLVILILSIFYKKESVPTVKYFPFDEEVSIETAKTTLQTIDTPPWIEWRTNSSSSKRAYLRQDISLLYENGIIAGELSKWKQEEQTLTMSENIRPRQDTLFQAISFHHGEIHTDDKITSTQRMTAQSVFAIKKGDHLHTFTDAQNSLEQKAQESLKIETNERLFSHWNTLMNELQISANEYNTYPLIDLVRFETEPLPGYSMEETEKIIGQLWEGLYKNY